MNLDERKQRPDYGRSFDNSAEINGWWLLFWLGLPVIVIILISVGV